MPPKAKITREMIVDAALEITREDGAENINARIISKRLGCSAQPVTYHFKKVEDIGKREAADYLNFRHIILIFGLSVQLLSHCNLNLSRCKSYPAGFPTPLLIVAYFRRR